MAFTLLIGLILGKSKAGITLAAQLLSSDGTDYGDEIITGFSEIGNGCFQWLYEDFPDNFRGGVKFYEYGTPNDVLTSITLNPEERVGAEEPIEIEVGHSEEKYNVEQGGIINTGDRIDITTGVVNSDPNFV